MNISKEESKMYEVMKAIYDSGIPVSFKGSMVLKACLMEAGYYEDTRHTVDIDANWNSNSFPTTEQIAESLQKAINQAQIKLKVDVYREYGDEKSAGFELKDKASEEVLFTMDVDVNRPAPLTRIYEVEGLSFKGAAPAQIIADKVSSVSTDKVFRRIKDVIDLYYLSKVLTFSSSEVMAILNRNGRILGDFSGLLNRTDELKHSYEKFRFSGGVDKPEFEDIYQSVTDYIVDIINKKQKPQKDEIVSCRRVCFEDIDGAAST